jgi:membrane-bound lytic murein transglycosylase MltF
MRGGCLKWCIAFTCTTALIACSAPPPTTTTSTDARKPIPEAASEPAPSPADLASAAAVATGDLDALESRGAIRILVAPGKTDYFIDDGQQRGAAVDAGKAFESFANASRSSGLSRLRVIFISTQPEQLLSALTAGRGDIVAGRFAKTFDREDVVAFSEPIATGVREVLVTGPGAPPIVSLEDVGGRSIHVRKGSDHFASLTRLNGQLTKINKPVCRIVAMDPSLTDEDVLQMVNDGRVPVTVVDHNLATVWQPYLGKIAINPDVSVSQDGIYAWAVRKDSPKLLALVNDFIRTHDMQGLQRRGVRRQ